ncbi:MAG: copper-binding protein [Burkholderiaceae bacterium]|nr:MAG: copper-binding protein [Burkholderiaceae bacterium]TBR76391.1 MAG: copper-binding protein [Burkholderiaceae bacterium]
MKKIATTALVLASLLPAAAVLAQPKVNDVNQGMGKHAAASTQATHAAQGVIKKIDTKAGVITISHGPINSLNWPPMTMGFKVRDKALLTGLKEGQKVDFEIAQEGDDYVVTKVR